jgi:hypothetical protein
VLHGDAAAQRPDPLQVAGVIVSAWSKNQRKPSKGTSRFTASNTSRKRPIDSS